MADYVAGRGTTAMSIIGTALGGLNSLGGNNILGNGLLGGGCNDSDSKLVSRYELGLIQENAALKSQSLVDSKLLDVYNVINSQINTLNSKVDSNAAAQAVINCGFNSSIGILQTQVNGLLGMTKMVIPSTNICTASTTTTTDTGTAG